MNVLLRILRNLRLGFEDGPDLFPLFNDFPVFFLFLYGTLYAALSVLLLYLSGMLFLTIETLAFVDGARIQTLGAGLAVGLFAWLSARYAFLQLWAIAKVRSNFFRDLSL